MQAREDSLDEPSARAWLVHTAGRRRCRMLLDKYGSACAALAWEDPAPGALAAFLEQLRDARDRAIRILLPEDLLFPAALRSIPDPPAVLYVAGDPVRLTRSCIAVVGARRCSRAGASHARQFASELAAAGCTVVSGLALGIDAAAHAGALPHGRTIAVLGSGLLALYPAAHRRLAEEIVAAGGALVSEYAPRQSARPYQFPERNRLISGLAHGVLVVEAGERSGSLITARLALEQGREVMAVPGPIASPASRGCHRLLREGAALVESSGDILQALGWETPPPKPGADLPPLDPALRELLEQIGSELTTLDQLVLWSGCGVATLSHALIELELAGFVEQVPGGYIRRPVRVG
jgi:DNA processing protein